jgi:hypothetical protein
MDAVIVDDNIKYTYLLKPGISYIEGAKFILKDMDYPEEIFGGMSNTDISVCVPGSEASVNPLS